MHSYYKQTKNKESSVFRKGTLLHMCCCVFDVYIEDWLYILQKKNTQLLKKNFFYFTTVNSFDSYQYA